MLLDWLDSRLGLISSVLIGFSFLWASLTSDSCMKTLRRLRLIAVKSRCFLSTMPTWWPGKGFSYIEMTVSEITDQCPRLRELSNGRTVITQYQPCPCPCPLRLVLDMSGWARIVFTGLGTLVLRIRSCVRQRIVTNTKIWLRYQSSH